MQEHISYNALNILFNGAFAHLEQEYNKYGDYETTWKKQNNFVINPEKEYAKLENHNIKLILKNDPDYPLQLKEISHAPLGIYVKGNIDILQRTTNIFLLAVVGSRKTTDYGQEVCETVIRDLSIYNFIIISGLAYGTDAHAHQNALNNNLKTIAVLGSGIENLYPKINQNLAQNIIEHDGAIISEYPINSSSQYFHFPQRNRIISGLSQGVLIIEAKEKSGSLITAKLALEQNREVFAIPNSIFEKSSWGTNKLIQSGAKLVLDANDILDELNILAPQTQSNIFNQQNLNEQEKLIFDFIQKEDSVDLDALAENLEDLQINEILASLTSLELKGLVEHNNDEYSIL